MTSYNPDVLIESFDLLDRRILKVLCEKYPEPALSKDFDGRTGLHRSSNLKRLFALSQAGLLQREVMPGTECRSKPPFIYVIDPSLVPSISERLKRVQYANESARDYVDSVDSFDGLFVEGLQKRMIEIEKELSEAKSKVAKLEEVLTHCQNLIQYYKANEETAA